MAIRRTCAVAIVIVLALSFPAWASGNYTGTGFTWLNNGYDGSLSSMGSSSIVVPPGEPGGDLVSSISLELDGQHTWIGDMTIKLAGPAGVVTLVSRPGLNEPGDNGASCCGSSSDWVLGFPQSFVDGAAILAENMGAAGPMLPAQELQPTGVFDGAQTPLTSLVGAFEQTSAVGEWTLYIGSSQGGDLGEVVSWTLHLTTGANPVPATSDLGLAILTLSLIAASMIAIRRRIQAVAN